MKGFLSSLFLLIGFIVAYAASDTLSEISRLREVADSIRSAQGVSQHSLGRIEEALESYEDTLFIRRRAESIGGTVSIVADENGGTKVSLDVKLK